MTNEKPMPFDEFADKILGVKLLPFQKKLYESLNQTGGKLVICRAYTKMGIAISKEWVEQYEKFSKHEAMFIRHRKTEETK